MKQLKKIRAFMVLLVILSYFSQIGIASADEVILKDGTKLLGTVLGCDLKYIFFFPSGHTTYLIRKVPRSNVMLVVFTPSVKCTICSPLPNELLGFKLAKVVIPASVIEYLIKKYKVNITNGAASVWVSSNVSIVMYLLICPNEGSARRLTSNVTATKELVKEFLKDEVCWLEGYIKVESRDRAVEVVYAESIIQGSEGSHYVGIAQWNIGKNAVILNIIGPKYYFTHRSLIGAILEACDYSLSRLPLDK